MKIWKFTVMVFLLVAGARPCSVSAVRKLWAKKPGSQSMLFAFERDGRVGFIDPTGKIVVKPVIEAPIEDVGDFSNGLARVDHQGYIDETGRFVIKEHFWWEYDFSDGLAQVLTEDPNQRFGYVGMVLDSTGKVVAKVPALHTREFSEGLVAYEATGKPGVRKFEPGNFVYRDYPGLKGFLDRTGKVVIKPAFAEVGPFAGGLARAVLDGYCHIALDDDTWEGSPTSGYPSDCGGAPSDAVSACKVGFINREGIFAIEPRFEAAQDFHEGLAAVRVGDLWGFIDTDGTVVIPPQFEQVQSFREGLAAAKLDGRWGFVDPTGLFKIPPQFDDVEPFSDSLAVASLGEKSFYIDRGGRIKIAEPYKERTPFAHGLAAVLLSDKHVAYIDHNGKVVFDYFRR